MDFHNFSKYLFVYTHPDDEIYTCVTISELIKKGKNVNVVYITSGDYNGPEFAVEREKETLESMRLVGMKKENVIFLRIPERQLMEKASPAYKIVIEIVDRLKPDCIVGHDFEGGHNMHDLVSFLAFGVANKFNTALYFFPAYYGWPEKRSWNNFVSDQETDYVLKLSKYQKELKRRVVEMHKSQREFMNSLLTNPDSELFFSREVLGKIPNSVDYTKRPAKKMGYEYPGSKLKFDDFRKIVEKIIDF